MRQPHRHRPLIRACAAPVVAGCAVATVTGAAHADPRADARQAACAYGHVIATYDYTNLGGYFAQELNGATDPWRARVESTKLDLTNMLTANQVRSVPTAVSCTVLALTGDRAQVALNIGSLVSSTASAGRAQPSQSNPTFTLRNVKGHWLVSDIAT